MTYQEFEKKMYESLLNEHKNNENFTFSLRKKKAKGAEYDYFIGTEKGGYSATTFWTIPIGYPGNSSDLINLFFFIDQKDNFSYLIEFNQTFNPHDSQNKISLELVKNLKNKLKKFKPKISKSTKNCKFQISNNKTYTDFNNFFNDMFGEIQIIIPVVDLEIIKLKEKNPEFKAHRISNNEFTIMNNNLSKRLSQETSISNSKESKDVEINTLNEKNENCTSPKNQILYGPPGTGKTYNTIHLAGKIITCNENISYDDAVKIYKENLGDRIKFVTFHQNFSYEDFVQGLRPKTDSDTMSFDYKDGIFKEIADKAKKGILGKVGNFDLIWDDFTNDVKKLKNDFVIPTKSGSSSITIKYESNNLKFYNNGKVIKDVTTTKENMMTFYFDNEEHSTNGNNNNYFVAIAEYLKSIYKYQSYVLIIDEINRANISRVFGELITLIEDDKRWDGGIDNKKVKWEVTLPSGDPFVVPDNLYIIGTMNTADKSIALLDVALRRRFTFRGYYPDSSLVHQTYKNYFESLNKLIVKELGAGRGHDLQIGHSYFMTEKDEKGNFKDLDFISVMNNKVIPLLLEYFMNNVEDVRKLVSESLKEMDFQLKKDSYPIEIEIKTDSKVSITEAKEVTE